MGQIGSVGLLVTGVQDLKTLGPLTSRLISRSSLSELLITSVTLLSVASLIAVLFVYFIVKERQNRYALFTISSLSIVVFVAELTLGTFFTIFFNQVR